jgi:hypothetical protein
VARGQRPGRDLPVCVLHDLGDLGPVGLTVDAHAHPAAVPDVWRPVVTVRIVGDMRLLRTGRRRAPDAKVLGAVVVVVQHREQLLVTNEEARLAVGRSLGDLWQGKAQLAQPLDG